MAKRYNPKTRKVEKKKKKKGVNRQPANLGKKESGKAAGSGQPEQVELSEEEGQRGAESNETLSKGYSEKDPPKGTGVTQPDEKKKPNKALAKGKAIAKGFPDWMKKKKKKEGK